VSGFSAPQPIGSEDDLAEFDGGEPTVEAGPTEHLVHSAPVARRDIGRACDVIDANVLFPGVPVILGTREASRTGHHVGQKPRDRSTWRPTHRVGELQIALWSGGDLMGKHGVMADLVHLALDDSGVGSELWVAGTEPLSSPDQHQRRGHTLVPNIAACAYHVRIPIRHNTSECVTFIAEHA
jgi:hypothetical protein